MTMWQGHTCKPIDEERLVRAVNVLAEIIEQHGPAYGPLYDSLQQELAEFRRRQQIVESAVEPKPVKRPRKAA